MIRRPCLVFWLSLEWRHNGHDCVSNHQPRNCLLNRLFGYRSKKTSKLPVTGLCAGNSPGTGEFPAQMANNAENVLIWWRHHVFPILNLTYHVLHAVNNELGASRIVFTNDNHQQIFSWAVSHTNATKHNSHLGRLQYSMTAVNICDTTLQLKYIQYEYWWPKIPVFVLAIQTTQLSGYTWCHYRTFRMFKMW